MLFLNKHNLLTDKQHGFVNKKSCVTNLLETMDFTTKTLSKGHSIDIILLDFAKAFDKVPHNRLIHKISSYGIGGCLLDWIKAFLTNRRQRVILGDHYSTWQSVASGVPQGSVLGPTLFIIYINDLTDSLENECKIYADDTKILCKINNSDPTTESNKLQVDIDKIVEWTKTWLKLNFDKCKIMHVGKANPKQTYSMKNYNSIIRSQINVTKCERDLGILNSNDLKPTHQVTAVASKANRLLGLLKRTFTYRDSDLWKKLYTSYFRRQIEFAVPAWCP